MADTSRTQIWTDFKGRTVFQTLRGNATLGPVDAQLAPLSNAAILRYWEGATNILIPTPVAAQYQSVTDVANLIYTDASGGLVTVQIPAPVSSIFLADQETVDPTMIAALTTAVTGLILTPGGLVVSGYVGGTRAPR